MQTIKRTAEQENIVRAIKENKSNLKIKAYAGTGKTTTLFEIVKENPDKNFLLLAFNKSVAEEIKKKQKKLKLKNLNVYTLHGLAYYYLFIANGGFKRGKPLLLSVKQNEITESVIENLETQIIQIWGYDINPSFYTFLVHCFNALTSSPYAPNPNFTLVQFQKQLEYYRELKFWYQITKSEFLKMYKNETETDFDEKLIKTLNLLWEKTKEAIEEDRKSIEERNIQDKLKYSHEAYIKYFHYLLSSKKIKLLKPKENKTFDYLLLDEAQDVNGVNIGIINALQNQGLKAVIVGDPHQNIYNWRGAINTFAYYKNWEEYTLSTSFRFENQKIVDYANVIIQTIKGEKKPLKTQIIEKKAKEIGFISRTNAGLIQSLNFLMKIEEDINKISEFAELETYGDKDDFYNLFLKIIEKQKKKKGEIEIKLLRGFYDIFSPIWTAQKFLSNIENIDKCLELSKQYLPKYVFQYLKNNPSMAEYYFSSETKIIELFEEFREEELKIATLIILKFGIYNIQELYRWAKEKYEKGTLKDRGKGKFPIVLSTIHTAKGLEWDYVVLINDIKTIKELTANWILEEYENIELLNPKRRNEIILETLQGLREFNTRYNDLNEEINLIYVAITRAKKDLLFVENALLNEFEKIKEEGIQYLISEIDKLIQEELSRFS